MSHTIDIFGHKVDKCIVFGIIVKAFLGVSLQSFRLLEEAGTGPVVE